jgi:release factor glutamine methyltransferase
LNRQSESRLWTIRDTLEWVCGHFEAKGLATPRLDAQRLLADATGFSRLELYTNYDLPLSEGQLRTLREKVRRRAAGEPLQYILGKAAFRRLELIVRPGVLIPRPETEILVGIVLDELRGAEAPAPARDDADAAGGGDGLRGAGGDGGDEGDELRGAGGDGGDELRGAEAPAVLELGTGSGCVALALLQEHPSLRVHATDVSPEAVALAQENAAALGLDQDGRLVITLDDLATSLIDGEQNGRAFDALVSNPPYIPTAELDGLPAEVADFEPRQALDGGPDGLAVFQRILDQARILLRPGGLLACELHEEQLDQAAHLCQAAAFADITIHTDLNSRPRVITSRVI